MAAGDRETAAAADAEQLESGESAADPLRRLVNGEKGFESHRSAKRSRPR